MNKTIRPLVLSLCLTLLFVSPSLAEYPDTDAVRNYSEPTLHKSWRVSTLVDSVEGRWNPNWREVEFEPGSWPVILRIPTRGAFTAVKAGPDSVTVKDIHGKPWILAESPDGTRFFVRAYRDYVSPAEPLPKPDQNGDYFFVRNALPWYWKVMDTDPAGLNGRFPKDTNWLGFTGLDSPYQERPFEPLSYPVRSQYPTGTVLKACGTHIGSVYRSSDTRGKPWLAVGYDTGACFVRAHKDYIRPIEGPFLSP